MNSYIAAHLPSLRFKLVYVLLMLVVAQAWKNAPVSTNPRTNQSWPLFSEIDSLERNKLIKIILAKDQEHIAEGKMLYNQDCKTCHGKDANGGTGPRLNDDEWLHGNSIPAMYRSIQLGYADKGMQAWQKRLDLTEIASLIIYIRSCEG